MELNESMAKGIGCCFQEYVSWWWSPSSAQKCDSPLQTNLLEQLRHVNFIKLSNENQNASSPSFKY